MANRLRNEHPQRLWERFPIPTNFTLCLLILGIGVAALLNWKVVLGLDLGILVLSVVDYVLTFKGGEIQGERICPRHFSIGTENFVGIRLRNPLPYSRRVRVRDQTPLEWPAAPVLKVVIPGKSPLNLNYPAVPPERGRYGFGDIFIRVEGPLGLISRPMKVSTPEEVRVYPSLQSLRCANLATYRRVAHQWGLRPTRWRGEGREFESLREYVEGDDPRKIHWKATARFDRPIVQQYQTEKNQIVMILLDVGRLMSAVSEGKTKLDHALEAALHLAHTALEGGDQAGILAFADRVISFVPPKKTAEQLQFILEGTLSLRPVLVEAQYEQAMLWVRARVRRRSLVVIYTDLLDEVASENLLSAVSLLRPTHLPLCIAIRESEWDELLSDPPTGVQNVYERAVLQELLHKRSKALGGLVQKGALAMDLPPSKLSTGTMERYLEVKRRGLL
jgi:uncharacterized protein (DUF58 family)